MTKKPKEYQYDYYHIRVTGPAMDYVRYLKNEENIRVSGLVCRLLLEHAEANKDWKTWNKSK